MIRTVIIDDEPNAIELLQGYLHKIPFAECIHSFRDPIEALLFINEEDIDLLLLDINMPQLSGISLLKTLENPPKIIFTTAYTEYAVESYEYKVTDYLLKPISFERFLKAMLKVKEDHLKFEIKEDQKENVVFIKSGQQQHKIVLNHILYLQKDGNYITYMLHDKKILARQSTKEALENLSSRFIQIHKSIIVHLDKIQSFDSSSVIINNHKLPIGQSYKLQFLEAIKS